MSSSNGDPGEGTNGGSTGGSDGGSTGGSDGGSTGGSDGGSTGGSDRGSGGGSSPGRREVAYRVFAAEYEDSIVSHTESDEERAPNYVVTPTGGRVNRLFVVGVLTEIERVSDEMLRGRIVDPTGAFVTYAGQYQPDALGFLDATEPPTFVALTGKARTFQPEDSDRVYSSVRPETITEVDADTRDRWVVRTAELTLERVATTAAAKLSGLQGEELRRALVEEGVDEGLADGIAIALEEYGTTGTYLEAVRELALDAVRVVAGELDEASQLSASPAEGGDDDLEYLVDPDRHLAVPGGPTDGPSVSGVDETDVDGPPAGGTAAEGVDAEEPDAGAPDAGAPDAGEPDAGEPEASELASEGTRNSGSDPGEFDSEEFETEEVGTEGLETEEFDSEEFDSEEFDSEEFEPGDFDMDEETRQQVQEEHGVEFETGSEVEGAGERTDGTTQEASDERVTASEAESSEPEVETTDREAERSDPEAGGPDREAADDGETVDLETALMETMAERSDGGGVDRAQLVATLVEEYGVSEDDVETAIQDALMSGRCYEPDEGTLKPI